MLRWLFPLSVVALALPSSWSFAPESEDALRRQVHQRLTCAQHLFAADLQEDVSKMLFGERSSLGEAPQLQKVVGEILDNEAGLRFTGSERQAFRGWRRLHGQERVAAVAVATPFWVRNAFAFVQTARKWSGVQKAAVFRILANAIQLRNTPMDLNLPAMWNVAVNLSKDGDYVFHGPRHRLVILDMPAPYAHVMSTAIPADELQFSVWPHTAAGTLGDYYRTQSYRHFFRNWAGFRVRLTEPSGPGPEAAVEFLLDVLGIRSRGFRRERTDEIKEILPRPPHRPNQP